MSAESNEVSGKVAIITGAASGIGRAIAELFHSRGAMVIAEDKAMIGNLAPSRVAT